MITSPHEFYLKPKNIEEPFILKLLLCKYLPFPYDPFATRKQNQITRQTRVKNSVIKFADKKLCELTQNKYNIDIDESYIYNVLGLEQSNKVDMYTIFHCYFYIWQLEIAKYTISQNTNSTQYLLSKYRDYNEKIEKLKKIHFENSQEMNRIRQIIKNN
jgi:hypothetical protein